MKIKMAASLVAVLIVLSWVSIGHAQQSSGDNVQQSSDNQTSQGQAAQDMTDEEIHNLFKSYIENGNMVVTEDGTAYIDDSHIDSELSAHGKGYQCTSWQSYFQLSSLLLVFLYIKTRNTKKLHII